MAVAGGAGKTISMLTGLELLDKDRRLAYRGNQRRWKIWSGLLIAFAVL